jgi:hypothetical protein
VRPGVKVRPSRDKPPRSDARNQSIPGVPDQPKSRWALPSQIAERGDASPGPWAFRRVEPSRVARIRIDLDQEERVADLIEVEVERLASVTVRADDAPHQAADADRDAERFEPAKTGAVPATSGLGSENASRKRSRTHRLRLISETARMRAVRREPW